MLRLGCYGDSMDILTLVCFCVHFFEEKYYIICKTFSGLLRNCFESVFQLPKRGIGISFQLAIIASH